MTTTVILTRGIRGNPPGARVRLTDGKAATLIAAGLARRARQGHTPQMAPQTPDADLHGAPQPPRHGPGSTTAAWTKWATHNGYQVNDDMTRNEIIALVHGNGNNDGDLGPEGGA